MTFRLAWHLRHFRTERKEYFLPKVLIKKNSGESAVSSSKTLGKVQKGMKVFEQESKQYTLPARKFINRTTVEGTGHGTYIRTTKLFTLLHLGSCNMPRAEHLASARCARAIGVPHFHSLEDLQCGALITKRRHSVQEQWCGGGGGAMARGKKK